MPIPIGTSVRVLAGAHSVASIGAAGVVVADPRRVGAWVFPVAVEFPGLVEPLYFRVRELEVVSNG